MWYLDGDSVQISSRSLGKYLVTINNTNKAVHDVLLTLAARKVSSQVTLRLMEHVNCRGKDCREFRESVGDV